jgi:hypothetical protein
MGRGGEEGEEGIDRGVRRAVTRKGGASAPPQIHDRRGALAPEAKWLDRNIGRNQVQLTSSRPTRGNGEVCSERLQLPRLWNMRFFTIGIKVTTLFIGTSLCRIICT